MSEQASAAAAEEGGRSSGVGLLVAAAGVVYGDIGTSPLYTFKTAIEWAGGKATPEVALGILSLVVWTLLITTSIKYVAIVMRADNDGEGGILALMSLIGIKHGDRPFVIALGHTLMHHDADASFPSDHLTFLWSVAFSLMLHRPRWIASIAFVLLGFPVAWARIYLGVHYPLDMVGAALVASASAALTGWRGALRQAQGERGKWPPPPPPHRSG